MAFEIVDLEETWVAGLPVRSPKRALGRLNDPALDQAWSSVLKQDIGGPLASVYTDFAPGIGSYNTQIVGYRCSTLAEVTRGHLVARIPAAKYAKFSSVGHFPDVMVRLWQQIEHAEEQHEITRTFTADYECYPHAYKIDLYLSIELSGARA
ncbi:AraC family transcriptional regulator [Rhodococcus sp. RS1C4]|uniref:GyrI-like domain-containing protein n=1 Tax=Nocardiaceae TaxID=85025 RepID=UPI00036831A8|nr:MULTISPECIES: GyrI-like domain-containing protein [Rhodococcus]OZC55372.1 AraC family transcriptional regulator [Rhodococcus sp. 06-621-2]OZC58308.1 AraC family transcriptional regulator [Rhodococcus sp. RS1C4]OZC88143.1 AraC family transcriptional regulator [Rhodococcus sp. 06-418-1B]OZD11714.1 AraC family transcriptional regulator [Rhodococcus sp. 06-156-4C]OZD15557.1 AraC family transcriptional regulator [Rhodococcus sp. 06-156-4a]